MGSDHGRGEIQAGTSLVALIDYNKVQLDGHNAGEVLASFDWVKSQHQWPVAVIYKTHKGRGVSFMEDNAHWHGAVVDDESYAKARPELLQTLQTLQEAL